MGYEQKKKKTNSKLYVHNVFLLYENPKIISIAFTLKHIKFYVDQMYPR